MTGERREARAALASGTALVAWLYDGTGELPPMVALSVLRELDLLLRSAIGEAASTQRTGHASIRHSARRQLTRLGITSASDDEALRRLDISRRRLAQGWRAASAGKAAGERTVSHAVLAAAGHLYGRLSRQLSTDLPPVRNPPASAPLPRPADTA